MATAATHTASDAFNRFVEGEERTRYSSVPSEKREFWDSFGEDPKGPDADKKDFWDSFGGADEAGSNKTSIGTSAMKSKGSASTPLKKDDEWSEW